MRTRVHVLVGRFGPEDAEALAYTQEVWAPEPGDDVSDDAYAAWEDENPKWQLRDDLGKIDLDADFIETIRGETRWAYLAALLEDSDAAAWIAREHADADTLVLVFEAALGGSEATLSSTPRLRYLGAFAARLE